MCGIVGFTEIDRQHRSCWMDCLNWNYRGYDSAGLVVRDGENFGIGCESKRPFV